MNKPSRIEVGDLAFSSDESGWCLETANGPIQLAEIRSFLGVLPLLEMDLHEVQRALAKGHTAFPISELVTFALTHASAYWMDLAVAWIEQMDVVHEDVVQILGAVATRAGLPQNLRHRSRKLFRRLEAGRPAP